MNVPSSMVFEYTDDGVKVVVDYKLPEGWNGMKSATFGLKFSEYHSVGLCLQELLREVGIHAQRVDSEFEAEAKRRFFQEVL